MVLNHERRGDLSQLGEAVGIIRHHFIFDENILQVRFHVIRDGVRFSTIVSRNFSHLMAATKIMASPSLGGES